MCIINLSVCPSICPSTHTIETTNQKKLFFELNCLNSCQAEITECLKNPMRKDDESDQGEHRQGDSSNSSRIKVFLTTRKFHTLLWKIVFFIDDLPILSRDVQ